MGAFSEWQGWSEGRQEENGWDQDMDSGREMEPVVAIVVQSLSRVQVLQLHGL